jgi:hypothetical protein
MRYTIHVRFIPWLVAALSLARRSIQMELMLLFVFVALMVALALRGIKNQRVAVRVPVAINRRHVMRRR